MTLYTSIFTILFKIVNNLFIGPIKENARNVSDVDVRNSFIYLCLCVDLFMGCVFKFVCSLVYSELRRGGGSVRPIN